MDAIASEFAEIQIIDDILFFKYLSIKVFNLSVAKKVVNDRLILQREKAYPILCDIRQLNFPTLEARRYLAVQGSILTKAVAYYTSPYGSNHLTDFFIKVDQPLVPTQVFTNMDDALDYLEEYK
ncbi:MAG: hypothetical protein CL868_19840 [Cytophagaceae bacterium]|nr:hypothetical protein [Cytophagaceae bacterium]|tara:strand:+ start:952 stop:1323 length:372 start_codon:yes stop_codon:yes gene_type:complete